jgi:hypothetical protein
MHLSSPELSLPGAGPNLPRKPHQRQAGVTYPPLSHIPIESLRSMSTTMPDRMSRWVDPETAMLVLVVVVVVPLLQAPLEILGTTPCPSIPSAPIMVGVRRRTTALSTRVDAVAVVKLLLVVEAMAGAADAVKRGVGVVDAVLRGSKHRTWLVSVSLHL